ncbi:hypothetical protein DFH29DRAFT_1084805, partial [Suillus ampliporus]
MPPRKKSEPSNAETTHSGFSLDTRPIQAKMPENDPAAEAQRLNQEVETARIGNGYINILDLENPLIFGTYNDRPEKMSEINKMMTSFERHGIQSMDEKNALVIIIERSRLSGNQSLDVPWTDINALPHVRFLDTAGLTLASGQHRVAALRKLMQTHTDELVVQLKRLERLQNIDNPSPAQQEEHRDLREHIAELKGATQIKGKWGVKLYDADILLASGKHLARHLSRNQSLHVYTETEGEVLVSLLRDMADANERDGQAGAISVLQKEIKGSEKEKNTRNSKILHNTSLMLCLMEDILPLGPHYRKRKELTVRWLHQAMNVSMGMYTRWMSRQADVLRLLASQDEFPKYQDTCNMIEVIAAGGKDAETTHARVVELRAQILASEPGDFTIFSKFLPAIDNEAIKHFAKFKGALGTWDPHYETCLAQYRTSVLNLFKAAWKTKNKGGRTADELVWLDRVMARMNLWLVPLAEIHMPLPLMTGSVMDNVWESLEAVSEGFLETSRWFEPLIDTHHIHTPYGHTLDDSTEALFRSVERQPGLQVSAAVNDIFTILWDARTTSLLQLHNKMSTGPMQVKMQGRPHDKKTFTYQWSIAPVSLKQSALALYNVVKPLGPQGISKLEPSDLKMNGMAGIVSTGWEWQRPSAQKNATREIQPSVNAIMLESHFADQYRPAIINNAIIGKFRTQLQNVMISRQIVTQLSLNPGGSRSGGLGLAAQKSWNFWDGLSVTAAVSQSDAEMSLERQTAEVKKQERLASDRVDRDIIMKAQKSIMNLALARSHRGKKAPVSKEVADALNILADALSLSASRVRLRTLHDKDDFVFRRRRDHRNLNVPLIVAEPDEHTLDDSSEDDESQVEEIDAPKGPKAPPKKSEGKRNVPDKSTPAEVQKPKLTLKQKGKARQPDPASPSSSENDSPVRLLEDGPKEPDTTITKKTAEPVDASAEIERPIPRPRPIAKKTRREVPDEQPGKPAHQRPLHDAHLTYRTVPSVVPEANADVVVPDIPMSPLSQMDEDTPNDPAHHAVDQNAQDDTVVAPPSLPLVTPDELAEEIDTLRRSTRQKQKATAP